VIERIWPFNGQTTPNRAKPSPPLRDPLDLSPEKKLLGPNGFSRRAHLSHEVLPTGRWPLLSELLAAAGRSHISYLKSPTSHPPSGLMQACLLAYRRPAATSSWELRAADRSSSRVALRAKTTTFATRPTSRTRIDQQGKSGKSGKQVRQVNRAPSV
jgi:hypothetical protein